ncbi:MAG: pseudouridine synthase [Acidobacteriota bacterium]
MRSSRSEAGERLQKTLARAGVGSRRQVERWIAEGRIRMNGRPVTLPGTRADLSRDHVTLDGKAVRGGRPTLYYVMNKPTGYVTTTRDPQGRPIVLDLLRGVRGRVFPVGRLDLQTSGVLIVTNDGDLSEKLLRPGTGCPKVYHAKVHGVPSDGALKRLSRGILVDGRVTLPCKIRRLTASGNSWLEVTLVQGRRNQIRKMFSTIGHPVAKLRRVAIGPISDRGIPVGHFRPLTPGEIRRLKDAVA